MNTKRLSEALEHLKKLDDNRETVKIRKFLDSLDVKTHDLLLNKKGVSVILDRLDNRMYNRWFQERIRLDYRHFSGIEVPELPPVRDRALKQVFLAISH